MPIQVALLCFKKFSPYSVACYIKPPKFHPASPTEIAGSHKALCAIIEMVTLVKSEGKSCSAGCSLPMWHWPRTAGKGQESTGRCISFRDVQVAGFT